METYDISIAPHTDGVIEFAVLGKEADDGWLLLQRMWTLMLSDMSGEYRAGGRGENLLQFLEGANKPPDSVMDTLLALNASTAMSMLDQDDRDRIASFTAKSVDGEILCTLKLKDGTTLDGRLG